MVGSIASGSFKGTLWSLAATGLATLVLAAMVASPVRPPPELTSISKTAGAVDRSTMPAIDRFHARDGTELGYRHYPARPPASGQIAVVVHGSAGWGIAGRARGRGRGHGGV